MVPFSAMAVSTTVPQSMLGGCMVTMFSGFESISPPKGKTHKKLEGYTLTMFSGYESISPIYTYREDT